MNRFDTLSFILGLTIGGLAVILGFLSKIK
jgi:hypothetical protein